MSNLKIAKDNSFVNVNGENVTILFAFFRFLPQNALMATSIYTGCCLYLKSIKNGGI